MAKKYTDAQRAQIQQDAAEEHAAQDDKVVMSRAGVVEYDPIAQTQADIHGMPTKRFVVRPPEDAPVFPQLAGEQRAYLKSIGQPLADDE